MRGSAGHSGLVLLRRVSTIRDKQDSSKAGEETVFVSAERGCCGLAAHLTKTLQASTESKPVWAGHVILCTPLFCFFLINMMSDVDEI